MRLSVISIRAANGQMVNAQNIITHVPISKIVTNVQANVNGIRILVVIFHALSSSLQMIARVLDFAIGTRVENVKNFHHVKIIQAKDVQVRDVNKLMLVVRLLCVVILQLKMIVKEELIIKLDVLGVIRMNVLNFLIKDIINVQI